MSNQRRKIIYVDDVNYSLIAIKNRLKDRYEVYPAQSTEKMFSLLENIVPDLILLDINMPGTDGFEAIKRLKSNPDYTEIPVIFLTGNRERSSVVKGMGLGAVDIVFKPFSDEKLIDRIEYQFNIDEQKANKPIILAVDDTPSILKAVHEALRYNYNVYTLPKPEALKETLKLVTPDMFVLDCNMPVLSGFDLIPVIRSLPAHEETPIIFLTSEGTMDNMSAAVELGACDFILKPVDEKLLLEKVELNIRHFMTLRLIRSLNVKDKRSY
ncbi:MAG: response regulator [Oscillospiraceae bacterium]|nr:response regulator [Oscillospiraceae bacterium]